MTSSISVRMARVLLAMLPMDSVSTGRTVYWNPFHWATGNQPSRIANTYCRSAATMNTGTQTPSTVKITRA